MFTIHLASFNVNSLNSDSHRQTLLAELTEHKIDIVCLQETKVLGKDSFDLENYKVFYCGRNTSPAKYGVGFAIKKSCFKTIEFREGTKPTERIYYLVLKQASLTIHLINVYAPHNGRDASDKEEFYANLEKVFTLIPASDVVFLIGDLNAKVGRDQSKWPNIIGEHGFGETNNNGNRLLNFCVRHDLVITNTCFEVEEGRRATRLNPDRTITSQLDLCVTRQRDIAIIKRTEPCAYLLKGYDHRMVIVDVEIDNVIKHTELQMEMSRNERLLLVSVSSISAIVGNDLTTEILNVWIPFKEKMTQHLSKISTVNEKVIFTSLQDIFDKIKLYNNAELSLSRKGEIKSELKNSISQCLHSFFQKAGLPPISSSHEVIKYASSLSDDFTDEVENAVPHKKLSNRFFEVSSNEVTGAIDSVLHNNVNDIAMPGLQLDALNAIFLSEEFLVFFNMCWKQGIIPQEILLADALSLNSTVSNIIWTLSIVKEIFHHCVYRQLKDLIKLEESFHCCLMTFSTREMLFSLNLMQDMFLAKHQPLYIALVDLSTVSLVRDTDFIIVQLRKMSIPINLVRILRSLLVKSKIITKLDKTKEESSVEKITMQLFWSFVLKDIFSSGDRNVGIEVVTRLDGDPFNRRRLSSRTLVETLTIRAFVYGGLVVFLAHFAEELLKNMKCVEKHFKIIGLDVEGLQVSFLAQNTETTDCMSMRFNCFGQTFGLSEEINVLGFSFCSDKIFTKGEINARIKRARKLKTEMQYSLKQNADNNNKVTQYKIHILSPLILNLDILTIDSKLENAIDKFHATSLIELQDLKGFVGESTVLGTKSIPTILSYRRLVLFGDLYRLGGPCNIKRILYGDLKSGNRKRGRQPECFLHLCKIDLEKFGLDNWESVASKKEKWMQKLNEKLLDLR